MHYGQKFWKVTTFYLGPFCLAFALLKQLQIELSFFLKTPGIFCRQYILLKYTFHNNNMIAEKENCLWLQTKYTYK